MTPAIELRNISKHFGEVIANKNVSMSVFYGEILALLGENGSGKTTLMNMLSGIYFPDGGMILVDGKEVSIQSPNDAYQHGIGMIHQHFKLVDVFSATENIALGLPKTKGFDLDVVNQGVKDLIERYGFELDPEKKIYDMSVSEKQTVEIIKMLYRGANILILDEPTAVLTPQETDKLFAVLRKMKNDGKAIIIITHKMNEVLELSDKVAILRKGEYIDTVITRNSNELSLTEMMVGKKVELNIDRPLFPSKTIRLSIRDLTVQNKYGKHVLDRVSFDAYGGEILGIAGIAGSGQKELLESVAGLQNALAGSKIEFYSPTDKVVNLINRSPRAIKKLGISLSFVPEDRLGMGLVGSMGMTDNMMLRSYKDGKTIIADRRKPREIALEVQKELEVVTPSIDTAVRKLSGGNVQKVLVGREIAQMPIVFMTAYAVRGLDINTSYTIYHLLNEQKMNGVAVVYVGEDLDVLLALSDRIMVLCDGKVTGIVDAKEATKEQIGLLMTKNMTGCEE